MNYELRPGSIICDTAGGLAGLSSHSKVPGGSSAVWVASDSTDPDFLRPTGVTKVFKIECTDHAGGVPAYRFDWVINEPMSAIHSLSVPIYTNGSLSSVFLTASEDTGFTKNYAFDGSLSPNAIPSVAGWTTFHFTKPVYSVTGSPVETNNWTRIRITITCLTSTLRTLYVGPIRKNMYSVPRAAFVFDDGNLTHYTEAFAYMNARGIVGSLALSENALTLSTAQLNEMYDAGWSFHNHGHNHINFNTLTESELLSEIVNNQRWLRRNGWRRGENDLVYPTGNANASVQATVARVGYRSAWSTLGKCESIWQGRLDNPYNACRALIDSTVTLASLKTRVDRMIGSGMACVFYGHPWVSGAVGAQTELATGQGLVDYLIQKQVKVMSLHDLVGSIISSEPKKIYRPEILSVPRTKRTDN